MDTTVGHVISLCQSQERAPPWLARRCEGALEHSQLVAKGKVLQDDISEASGRNEETKQRTKQRERGV